MKNINWPAEIERPLPWEKPQQSNSQPDNRNNGDADLHKRISAYLAAIPGAVSGQGGHTQTFKAACELINGWALSAGEALPYLQTYNQRCEPPWSDKELAHKLADAEKAQHAKPRGHLQAAARPRDMGDDWEEPEHPAKAAEPKPLRPMPSWITYGELEVDRTQYHIGEGFLEIGGFIMLIGASYVGKSTLVTQLSICLAISRAWLFFNVERALRVLVVQAEDPRNKLIKMGQMHKRMGLSPEQIQLAEKNTAVLTIRDLQDSGALAEIERHVLVFKPDIIIINPLTSYLSGSIYKDEVINRFLRVDLTQMLDRLHLSAIVVHHPPKPLTADKEPKDLTAFELQYGGAGMAALANAPRGNMFLVHVDGDVFKLTVGKGFEDLGTRETAVFLRRSKDAAGVMLWERCEQNQAEEAAEKLVQRKARKQSTKFVPYDRLLKLLRPTEKYSPLQVRQIVKERLSRGENFTKDALKELVREKRLALTKEKNPNGGPFVFYHLPTLLEPADNNPNILEPDPEDIP